METCYHCGDLLPAKPLRADEHDFCCQGCVSVYHLLHDSKLDQFYKLEAKSGVKPDQLREQQFEFLDLPEFRSRYLDFEDGSQAKITLYLPSIHCSSCIYLLENIHKIEPRIQHAFIHFARREASFTFDPQQLKLSELAGLLTKVGYQPNFGNRKASKQKLDKVFLYKIGVAGFAFGSIMLWSFPEYLGVAEDNPTFRSITAYMSLAVSIPVLLFSANEYLISAWKALRFKHINLDVPITIGIFALYAQSVYSILQGEGPGYIDSFAGFIFFLLIGKWFQQKTYQTLSFERDYTSYFPVAVNRLVADHYQITDIEQLEEGDQIQIRNDEIVPCDALLLSDSARIDFSFVTGESDLVAKKKGDLIFAGGKLVGASIALEVKNRTSRSHLTRLWNEARDEHHQQTRSAYQDRISGWFLLLVLSIALISGAYWFFRDATQVTRIVVSILIVTCPCALALSSPFTLGNIMRLLGRKGLYLKNAVVTERINAVTDVVFDKTGTLTSLEQQVDFEGSPLNEQEMRAVLALCSSSVHPLAQSIRNQLALNITGDLPEVLQFEELAGAGMRAQMRFQDQFSLDLRMGSAKFNGVDSPENDEVNVHLSINNHYKGRFVFRSQFRTGIAHMIEGLSAYRLHVLTGDKRKDEPQLRRFFGAEAELHFEQSPADKLAYIRHLQENGRKVLMIGDGLNDAGALREAYSGFAVSENAFRFSPAADAIIDSRQLVELPVLLRIARQAKTTLAICLTFSVLYNLIGLSFAVSGQLTPLVAAILMPISSITVVFISTFTIWVHGNRKALPVNDKAAKTNLATEVV